MSDRDRLAAVIYEHFSCTVDCECDCGWKPESLTNDLTEYSEHVADALIAAGVTMPAAEPNPEHYRTGSTGVPYSVDKLRTMWPVCKCGSVVPDISQHIAEVTHD